MFAMGAMRLCLLLFCLFLVSDCSLRKLKKIDDLKDITYAKSAPRHGLQLLFWFAQIVLNVDQNNNVILDSNFDPTRGDFGFHQYDNKENLFPLLATGQRYYSVGNLKSPAANALPAYVRTHYRNTNVPERNMDRLIVAVKQNNPNRILKVFITEHNLHRSDFNPADTYEIDPALLLQIGDPYNCTLDANNNYEVSPVPRNTKDLVNDRCLKFLIEAGYNTTDCRHSQISHRKKRSPYLKCNAYEGIKLDMKVTAQGSSKLIWKIPEKIMENSQSVYVDICQNTFFSETNELHTKVSKRFYINKSSGNLDTSLPLNGGLQPRLRLYPSLFDYQFTNPYIWYGPEFDQANGLLPTAIKEFDASLQLFAKDGQACARLYIKKTFQNWKTAFTKSWVGFYKSSQDENDDYLIYQYADRFPKIKNGIERKYDIYEYNSGSPIAPGVQIRFLLDKKYDSVLARTTPWEGAETLMMSSSDCTAITPRLLSERLSIGREMFYGPGLDAGLQLFRKDGKACARVYIKKTFTNWKDVFYYSWVGFYSSARDKIDEYQEYQYVTKFEMIEEDISYNVYEYKSSLDIVSGVQIRFLLDKGSQKVLAQTKPWKSG